VIDQSAVAGIPVGTSFSGTVSYNPAGPLLGSGSNFANYSVGGAGYGIVLNVGAFFFTGNGYLNMMVSNGPDNTRFFPNADVVDINADSLSSLSTDYPGFIYYGVLVEFVGSLNLAPANIIPNPFPTGELFLNGAPNPSSVYLFLDPPGQPSSGASVRGVLNSAAVVPEPGSSGLLMIGLVLGATAFTVRRRTFRPGRGF
jgi:hypothetical protein